MTDDLRQRIDAAIRPNSTRTVPLRWVPLS